MKLHEDTDEFRAAVIAAAAKLKLPEHIVEKDYWVTQLLQNLSRYQHHQYVIFKGGTCLSKGYKLIRRFSEDIDLALDDKGIGVVAKRKGDVLHTITKEMGLPQKSRHSFKRMTKTKGVVYNESYEKKEKTNLHPRV